jgi:aspartate carbamoyltransferase catalytic subunit
MEKLHHLIKAELLTPSIVTELLKEAESFNQSLRAGVRHFENPKGMTLCSLFCEEGTRTCFSFERAVLLSGANIISNANPCQLRS